ncbi:MAG: hypothetical protein ACR2HR_06405 [Euzebya sp.]
MQLQWLALLLLRVAQTTVDGTWRNIRDELDRLHLVTLATALSTACCMTSRMAVRELMLLS